MNIYSPGVITAAGSVLHDKSPTRRLTKLYVSDP